MNKNRPKSEIFELLNIKTLKFQPMDCKVNEQKLIEIFIWTDDFVKSFSQFCLPRKLGNEGPPLACRRAR